VNVLVVADIHNDVESLMAFLDKIAEFEFEVVVCPGDVTNFTLPRGFSRADIARLVIEELRTLGKPVFVIPGNLDKEIIPTLEAEGVSLHGRGRMVGEVGLYGFGGARTPFDTPLEPTEDEVRTGLGQAWAEVKEAKLLIQVTHTPPARTRLDRILAGAHVGSEAVRTFIEEHKPAVAISAHIHEARGTDRLGVTKLINPGRFPEGYCGLITLEKENIDVKIVNLT
jgi:hypothetical protein